MHILHHTHLTQAFVGLFLLFGAQVAFRSIIYKLTHVMDDGMKKNKREECTQHLRAQYHIK